MRRALAALFFGALLPTMVTGQDATLESAADAIRKSQERFELFNACRPVPLNQGISFADEHPDTDLVRERLRLAAEIRLRAARLYAESPWVSKVGPSYLSIGGFDTRRGLLRLVGRPEFSVSLQYWKSVTDEFGNRGSQITWERSVTGTSVDGIVAESLEHLDRFLAAYLHVNEEACGPPAGQP